MLFIPHVEARIRELFPIYLRDELQGDQYRELVTLLNEVVREARKKRSDRLPLYSRPEDFLLQLFQPILVGIVHVFFGNFVTFRNDAIKERGISENQNRLSVSLEETPTFKEWLTLAQVGFITIVLGDSGNRRIREKISEFYLDPNNDFSHRHLDLNYLWFKNHVEQLLGRSGPNKQPDCLQDYKTPEHLAESRKLSTEYDPKNPLEGLEQILDKEPGFAIRDEAAQIAAVEHARKYKQMTRDNVHYDEPTGFDPDYMPPAIRRLLADKEMADFVLSEWKQGEFPEIESEAACRALIEKNFIETTDSLKALEEKIYSIDCETSANLILFIRGTKDQKGHLYEMLRSHALFLDKRSKHEIAGKDEYRHALNVETVNEQLFDEDDPASEKIVTKGVFEGRRPLDYLLQVEHASKIADSLPAFEYSLTRKQQKIYFQVKQGLTADEIAKNEGKSLRNVRIHINNIKKLLNDFLNNLS
jgi:hypothetical protein